MNTDNIDRFGHCVICHKNLLTKKVVGGKVVDMFLPIYNDAMFLLDNGSQMQITICTPCKESTDLKDPQIHENIMEAVMKGWELETRLLVKDDKYPEWNEKKAKDYLETMGERSIDCHSDSLSKFAVQQRQMELRGLVVEDVELRKI